MDTTNNDSPAKNTRFMKKTNKHVAYGEWNTENQGSTVKNETESRSRSKHKNTDRKGQRVLSYSPKKSTPNKCSESKEVCPKGDNGGLLKQWLKPTDRSSSLSRLYVIKTNQLCESTADNHKTLNCKLFADCSTGGKGNYHPLSTTKECKTNMPNQTNTDNTTNNVDSTDHNSHIGDKSTPNTGTPMNNGDGLLKPSQLQSQTAQCLDDSTDQEVTLNAHKMSSRKEITLNDVFEKLNAMGNQMEQMQASMTSIENNNTMLQTRINTLEENVGQQKTAITDIEKNYATKKELEELDIQAKFETQQVKIQLLTENAQYQDILIKELQASIKQLREYNSKGIMTVNGIKQKKGENCVNLVKKFMSNVLQVKETIYIKEAHRIGGKDSTAIQFTLDKEHQKGLIYAHVANIKGKKNSDGDFYSIREFLIGAELEKNTKAREAIAENRDLSGLQKLDLKITKGKLHQNGAEYVSEIALPEQKVILTWPEDKLKEYHTLYRQQIKTGIQIQSESSYFQGYVADIETLDEISNLYIAMRCMHMDARHIVMAYRLPGRDFIKYQDGEDDGEWGASRYILNALKYANIMHRVVFVTRRYDGAHIGKKRFEAYLLAARSALANHPENRRVNVINTPWSEEYCKFSDTSFQQGKLVQNKPTRGKGAWRRGQWGRRRTGRGALPNYQQRTRDWADEMDPNAFDDDGFPRIDAIGDTQ